jgi:hypothetical protein
MESRATEGTPTESAKAVVPALHAFTVAPFVGSVVLMLVAVGSMALAIGALSAVVGYRVRKPRAARPRSARPTPS